MWHSFLDKIRTFLQCNLGIIALVWCPYLHIRWQKPVMFSYCTATCKKIFRDVRLNGNPPSLPMHTKTNYRQKRKPFIYWGSNKYSWYIYIVASGSLYIIFQRDLSAGLFGPRMMICVSKDQDCFNISIWVCMKRRLKTEDLHCYGQTNLLTMKS